MPDSTAGTLPVRHRALLAAGNAEEQAHLACARLLRQRKYCCWRIPVLGEIGCLLRPRTGPQAAAVPIDCQPT